MSGDLFSADASHLEQALEIANSTVAKPRPDVTAYRPVRPSVHPSFAVGATKEDLRAQEDDDLPRPRSVTCIT